MKCLKETIPVCIIFLFCICFKACSNQSYLLEESLRVAGMNRIELDMVLDYFKKDSLKHEAAVYLISNMQFHGTISGSDYDKYCLFHKLYSEKGNIAFKIIDSIQNSPDAYHETDLKTTSDLHSIKHNQLINHIEDAFKIKNEFPWLTNIDNETFFKYILPYRVTHESVSNWRSVIRNEYRPLLDSLIQSNCKEPLEVAKALIHEWNKKPFKWTSQLPTGPGIGILSYKYKAGTCREFAQGIVFILRAFGVPSGIDFTPIRGDANAGHEWPFVLDSNGDTHIATTENPYWHNPIELNIKTAKIYRQEFHINPSTFKISNNTKYITPSWFSHPLYSDITNTYYKTSDINIPINSITSNNDEKPYFLCLFNHMDCIPIDFGYFDNGILRFKNVSNGIVTTIGKYEDDNLRILTEPFEIMANGETRFISASDKFEKITLFCKYPLGEINGEVVNRVKGGVFEGSDYPDFNKVDTIYTILEAPFRKINTICLKKSLGPYKYVRYVGPKNSYCNIAEIAFYDSDLSTSPIKGSCIGTDGDRTGAGTHNYYNAFDGDIYTSFDYKKASGGWTGLKLSKPTFIKKLEYVPRNRDNFIKAGDVYELFYMKQGTWHSIERKTAESDSLCFIAPISSLLFLRNHTDGNQERIFEINKNGVQIFW